MSSVHVSVALRDYVVVDTTMQLIFGKIYRMEFLCDAESVRLYIDTRRYFITSDEYSRNTSKENSHGLYESVVSEPQSNATRYILEEYCGVIFPSSTTGTWWRLRTVNGDLAKGVSADAPFAVRAKAKANEDERKYFAEEIKILNETRKPDAPAAVTP